MRGRNILLGVTGGIAAYKAAELCRALVREGAHVQVVMTRAACEFVQPMTFVALSRREVALDLFDAAREASQNHVALARWADCVVVAPATADFIARVAAGRADDLLATIVLATEAPVLLAPAMNWAMLENVVTKENIERLARRPNVEVCESPAGDMAEPEEGPGRLLEPAEIARRVARRLRPRDLEGHTILVTAGPTREPIDPVRYLSNRSSGKMGYALAERAAARGADVVMVSGPTALRAPARVTTVHVETTAEMCEAVLARLEGVDAVLMAAAPADYAAAAPANEKIKKGDSEWALRLLPTPDILSRIVERKTPRTLVVGFAAETKDLLENAAKKIARKRLDLCVANWVGGGRGFDAETNHVWLVLPDGRAEEVAEAPKRAVADAILDRLCAMLSARDSGAASTFEGADASKMEDEA
jgi:phosphopantothenoylcysteine decarboxylase/phosphopantothenate--cysteine ligase